MQLKIGDVIVRTDNLGVWRMDRDNPKSKMGSLVGVCLRPPPSDMNTHYQVGSISIFSNPTNDQYIVYVGHGLTDLDVIDAIIGLKGLVT